MNIDDSGDHKAMTDEIPAQALGCSGLLLRCSWLLWVALGCSWAAPALLLGCSGLWAALSCSGLLRAALGRSGLLWAAPALLLAFDVGPAPGSCLLAAGCWLLAGCCCDAAGGRCCWLLAAAAVC